MIVEGEPPRPVPLAGRFKPAVSAPPLRDVAAILSFKRPAFTLPPKLSRKLWGNFRASPRAPRLHNRRRGHSRRSRIRRNARNRALAAVEVENACPPLEGRATFAQDGRSGRGPCPDTRLRRAPAPAWQAWGNATGSAPASIACREWGIGGIGVTSK